MQKKVKHIILSGLLMSVAIVIITLLTLLSNRKIHQKNGFKRNFFNGAIALENSLIITKMPRSICSSTGSAIYFETDTATNILKTDLALGHPQYIHLTFPNSKMVNSLFTTYIDSPFVDIMAGNVPAIISLNLDTKAKSEYHFPGNIFTRSVVIGKNIFVFRTYKKILGKWEQVFLKVNLNENITSEEKDISVKRGDAGFSTDGLLHYDELSHRLIFVNYYSNNFICLDTNLNLVYNSHTIDTFSTYQVAASNTPGKYDIITNISPIRDVNLQSCVSEGKLYINSALIADNETRTNFTHNSVIDVYNITNGLYDGSFYIPSYNDERLKEFKIYQKRVIALYPKHVDIYLMQFEM